jgi:acetyl-CoA/propionyl-CoA carboxylase biotin carboxyl carrier protein
VLQCVPPDQDALLVRAAVEGLALGDDAPAARYLDIDKVLQAATSSGADAIRPGYGSLSVNAGADLAHLRRPDLRD